MVPSRSYPVLQVRQAAQGKLAVRAGFVGTYIVSAALRTVHARGTRHQTGSVWCASKHGVRCVLRARASYLEIDAALIQYAYLLYLHVWVLPILSGASCSNCSVSMTPLRPNHLALFMHICAS
jgi:hypothetical protein